MPLPRPTRPRARRLLVLATVLFASLLALVPALTAADGDPPDTITVCHSTGGGEYVPDTALENDFYGTTAQGHGEHPADIVPTFVVDDPRPGDPGSFPGQNADLVGETLLANDCELPSLARGRREAGRREAGRRPGHAGPGGGNEKQVTICHSTGSHDNPYVVNHPAIENNGDLKGGHLDEDEPPYPGNGKKWGDIIPPFEYTENGVQKVFPGHQLER